MSVLVTGASGYVGSKVSSCLRLRDITVIGTSRRSSNSFPHEFLSFDFSCSSQFELPAGVDTIIHLAANTTGLESNDQLEIDAAKRLIDASGKCGAKFVFVSSQTAQKDAPTSYGRTKWYIEQEVLAANGIVVRPGLVYGGREKGLFGKITGVVRSSLILPALLPSPKVQPIHINDLTSALVTIATTEDLLTGVYCLGSPEPINFSKFLRVVASVRLRRRRFLLPLPTFLVRFVGILIGRKLRLRWGVDQLISLFELPRMETKKDLQRLSLSLAPLRFGMHCSGDGRRRELLVEARAFLTYVLRDTPPSGLMRRYVRAVEKLQNGVALKLPRWTLVFPVLLNLIGENALPALEFGRVFSRRMEMATLLAEATPQGAVRFLEFGRNNTLVGSLTCMTRAIGTELFWRFLRILFSPFLVRTLSKHQEGV